MGRYGGWREIKTGNLVCWGGNGETLIVGSGERRGIPANISQLALGGENNTIKMR